MVAGERASLREQWQQVNEQRLAEIKGRISSTIAEMERELLRILPNEMVDMELLRAIPREERLVQQVFLIDERGRRQFPSTNPMLRSNDEQNFLNRSEVLWKSGDRFDALRDETSQSPVQGWQVWYHGSGPRYLFWKRISNQWIMGAEVPAAVLTAEIIADLPADSKADATFTLLDAHGHPLYQWGQATAQQVQSRTSVAPPLGAWSLVCATPDVVAVGATSWKWNLLLGLGAAGLVMGLMAWHLYRESMREVKLAGQRVSFVNQVSHELKTPLTNISLYAELAAQKLPDQATDARECLEVVTSESARLGRLIGNVLTFSKHQRGQVQPRLAAVAPTEIIHAVLEQFRPSLASKQIEIILETEALNPIQTDADMLGQILGNLLSNVEKYASQGGKVIVSANQTARETVISVRDFGQGIPAGQHESIFAPFVRLSDKLSDGTTGTGIGLGIARDLARLLGGELISQSPATGPGACFVLTLPQTTSRNI
jgi:signal transduction histidine kinase